MNLIFEDIVESILNEFTDGATNKGTSIEFVDGDYRKGFYIYHACHESDRESIIQSGARRVFVANNVCCSYGEGLYATYTLASAKLNATRPDWRHKDGLLYGGSIVKGICKDNLKEFIIFDPNIAKQVYGREVGIREQLTSIFSSRKDILSSFLSSVDMPTIESFFKNEAHTAQGAYHLWHLIERRETQKGLNPRQFIKGLIFSGGNDGNVAVMYNMSSVEIVAYSLDKGNTFKDVNREEWVHKQLANDYDLANMLGDTYDEYPTQGFTNGFAVVGKRVNYTMKYAILSKGVFEYERRHGNRYATGQICDLLFDEVHGLTFASDGTLEVKYAGNEYILKNCHRGKYEVYDADEGVYLCDLNELKDYVGNASAKNNTKQQNSTSVDATDYSNLDLSDYSWN